MERTGRRLRHSEMGRLWMRVAISAVVALGACSAPSATSPTSGSSSSAASPSISTAFSEPPKAQADATCLHATGLVTALLGGQGLLGSTSAVPIVVDVGSSVRIVVVDGFGAPSIPVAESPSILRLACTDTSSTENVSAVFHAVAPGSTVVTARTQGCNGCAAFDFTARVTVRDSA